MDEEQIRTTVRGFPGEILDALSAMAEDEGAANESHIIAQAILQIEDQIQDLARALKLIGDNVVFTPKD